MRPILRVGNTIPWVAPTLPPKTIPRRESLREKLFHGLQRRLILIQAGAGCGKTAFLSHFAHEQRNLNTIPYAWLTLDRLHRDRICLLEDLVLALRTVHPEMGTMTLAALSKSKDILGRWDYFLELFCSEVCEAERKPTVVILDQYDRVVSSNGAIETIDYLVRALPQPLTLILSTRQPPDLPSIQDLRANEEVWDLSTSDLCFTIEEMASLIFDQFRITPSDDVLELLFDKTRGWPAAVQMAGTLIRRKGKDVLLDFSGSFPSIYDYLDTEVFQHESPGARSFLMTTALADEITPELGRALADDAEALTALARLEQGDYFVSVNETGDEHSYSHHPIFREFLLKKLERNASIDQVRHLHMRLAEFYSLSEQWDAVIHHLIGAAEHDRASDLVASLAESVIAANNLETLARWIDAFPAEERDRRPWLLLYRGVIYRVNREWEAALALYKKAADIFRERSEPNGLARALWYSSQVLAYSRNQQLATNAAAEALTYLDDSQMSARAWILHVMGNAHFDLGSTEEALACHKEAEQLFTTLGDSRGEMVQSHAIALALHRLGRLKEAQQSYLRALASQARSGDVNILCWVQAGLARIRAMRGDYSSSEDELKEVAGIARAHHLRPAETFALSCLADTYLDLGNYAEAEACCEQALVTCEEFDDDAPQIDLHLKLMELDLRRGHPASARESSPSVASWIAAANLEGQKLAHILLEASIFVAERQYEEAELAANKARILAKRIGARYHNAQACYLLAATNLQKGQPELSARLFEELLTIIEADGHVSFLLRDTNTTNQLLANALRHLSAREQLTTLILKLAGLRTEFSATLFGAETMRSKNELGSRSGGSPIRSNPVSNIEPLSATVIPSKHPSINVIGDLTEDQSSDGSLEVFLFGPMRVRRAGVQITDRAWRTSKAKELFAYLLAQKEASASRDELLEILWPEQSVDAAVRNFHFTLHSLRRALEPHLPSGAHSSFLVLSGRRYQLNLTANAHVDVHEFKMCVAKGSKLMQTRQNGRALPLLERAIELYQGDYVADLYADWVEPERQHLLRSYLNSLRQLAWSAYSRRNYDQVIHYVGTILTKDNYVEDAHRLLMQVACDTGNPVRALRQYDELARLLRDELGVQPEAATRQLHQQILEGTYQASLPRYAQLHKQA